MENVIKPLGSFYREPVKIGSVSVGAPAFSVSLYAYRRYSFN